MKRRFTLFKLKSNLNFDFEYILNPERESTTKPPPSKKLSKRVLKYLAPIIGNRKNYELPYSFPAFVVSKYESAIIICRANELVVVEVFQDENPQTILDRYLFEIQSKTLKEIFQKPSHIMFSIEPDPGDEENRRKVEELKAIGIIESEYWKNAEKLDRRTIEKIANIDNILKELKQTNNFFLIAPLIEVVLTNFNQEKPQLSKIVIDKDFKVCLPDYENLEIHLSHLTKAIYILFLKHPKGLTKAGLLECKPELIEIYKTISYQNSYEKIINTIDSLYKSDLKGFAIHFSRIKAAFVRKFSEGLAENYYLSSGLHGNKYIKLPTDLIKFE